MSGSRPPRRRTPTHKVSNIAGSTLQVSDNRKSVNRRKSVPIPDGNGSDRGSRNGSDDESPSGSENGGNRAPSRLGNGSQDRNVNNGSQHEEATSMLQSIIGAAIPVQNNTPRGMEENRTVSSDQEKDELINRLKIEVEDLKTERKRMSDHIEVLQALRKQHEEKIKEMKMVNLLSKRPLKRQRRKEKDRQISNGQVDISEICIFNEGVYKRNDDKETEKFVNSIIHEGYTIDVLKVLKKMYSRMSRLAYFVLNEVNIVAFINGSDVVFGTVSSIEKYMSDLVYDWYSCCYSIPDEQAKQLGLSDLVVHTVEQISASRSFLLKCPIERMRNNDFYNEISENTQRYLLQHGYIFMRLEEGDNSETQRSEFQEIIEKCDELQSRLTFCCRYTLGNKKRLIKQMYLHHLGYYSEKGVYICNQCQSTENSNNQCRSTRINELSHCVDCQRNGERLVKRTQSGTLVTNWWRRASHSQIGKEGIEEKDIMLQKNIDPNSVNKLFRNNASQDAFRRFFEYESAKCINHNMYTSVVNLARMDTWMSVMLLHTRNDAFKTRKGGLYIQKIVNDFKMLKSRAYQQLQREILEELRKYFSERGDIAEFEKELQVEPDGNDDKEKCNNVSRKFTIAVPMEKVDESVYYICVKPSIVKDVLCSWMGCVKDCFIGKVSLPENKLYFI